MTRLGIRARFALLTAVLVLAIAALVGAAGYLSLRHELLARARRDARDHARQLVALVDVGHDGASDGQANQVDLRDQSLTGDFTLQGLVVSVLRPGGAVIQASPGAPPLPVTLRSACLARGGATARLTQPPLALACARVGPGAHPAALIAVGVPLGGTGRALTRLAEALAVAMAAGTLLAAALARAVAHRALLPARRIAEAAGSIRAGDLAQRIDFRGPRDELGRLADILDACFAELNQAVERQRRFVGDASHELRTPLAAIRAHVDLLRRWASETPAARDRAIAAIDQASRAADRIGADLLYLAQLDRRPLVPHTPTQLDQIVVDAVRDAQPLRADVPVRITRLDEATLHADQVTLRRLLGNLLGNALRVSPAAVEVQIALTVEAQRATITVGDRGPGIPADRLERIFEPFYTTAPRGSGNAGLGLAIAREIARGHQGDVYAANRSGGGAFFRVELPLRSPIAAQPDRNRTRPRPESTGA
jgi:two-component system OmpR family sensor kinase